MNNLFKTNKMSVHHSNKDEGQTTINTITWTLPYFINVLESKDKEFCIDTNQKELQHVKTSFKLKIQFLGEHNDLIEIYYLFSKSIFVKCALALCMNAFTQRTLVTNDYHKTLSNKWQYLTTLFKRDIISFDKRNTFLLDNGSLMLQFVFHMFRSDDDVILPLKNLPERKLSNDFQNLLESGLYSDVIIKSVEGTEFKVHKAVLASRSTVLKAHFVHNTLECHTNIIESPLETDILFEVLTFIYSDRCPRIDDVPKKLLAAAEYYQLDVLKRLCEQALQEKLSVDNVIETLELAELHSAEMLKKMTLEFIKDGHTKHIAKTKGWEQVKSIELVKTIYEYVMNVNDKDEIR